ncbi:MAG: protein translocase subunit SecD, partial [Terriglobia bacterium]
MERKIRNRAILIIAVVLVCLFGIVGFPSNFHRLEQNLADRIKLGLDLKGGAYLVLQVHVEDAVNASTGTAVGQLQDELHTRNIPYTQVRKTDATHVLIKGVPQNDWNAVQSLADNQFTDFYLEGVAGDPTARILVMKTSSAAQIRTEAYNEARATIQRRVNGLGISEATIAEYGQKDFELVVEIPGVADLSRVRNIIQSTAMLELKIVRGGPYPSRDEALASFGGVRPPDTQLLPGISNSGGPVWYLVDSIAAVTGNDLRRAEPSQDSNGRPDVNFMLKRGAAARFAEITQRNIGKDLAIVLDNQVQSAPVIDGQISDNGVIQGGNFTPQSAADLALKLNSGALPASISYMQERTVGASLGVDSIHHGVEACIIGFVAILAFMLIYYKGAGINADVALILNLVILIAAMVYFHGVFTLPGIAGVILTVGMGVDSNVLVFERIREELRGGKAPPAAVAGGFDH